MRRGFVVLVAVIVLTLAGGGITANLLQVPTIQQSDRPDASVFVGTPEQAAQFFIWVGFVLVNVLGAGLTLGIVFWLLNRGLASSRSDEETEGSGEIAEQS